MNDLPTLNRLNNETAARYEASWRPTPITSKPLGAFVVAVRPTVALGGEYYLAPTCAILYDLGTVQGYSTHEDAEHWISQISRESLGMAPDDEVRVIRRTVKTQAKQPFRPQGPGCSCGDLEGMRARFLSEEAFREARRELVLKRLCGE